MTTPLSKKALVIGGSVGGLFMGTALRAIGWQVDIFERSHAQLDSRGGGIVLQPDVLNELEFAGLLPSDPWGVMSRDRLYLDSQGHVEHRQYMPQMQTSWNALYTRLLAGFPAAHYHRGATLTALTQDAQRVHAHFEDGSSAQGDLLIGADGPGSTVRSLMLPGRAPSYAGYVVWRGLVEENRLPAFAREHLVENFVFQQDPESMLLQYMVPGTDGSVEPGQRRFNWIWYLKAAPGAELDAVLTDRHGRRRSHSVPPGEMAPARQAWLRDMGERYASPPFRELIRHTDDIFVQAIQDFKVPKMVFDRVLLSGDAAFIPRPHTAGGTAKAAANALALAKHIQRYSDLDQALGRWQQQQLLEGTRMCDWGVSMGNRIMGIDRQNA